MIPLVARFTEQMPPSFALTVDRLPVVHWPRGRAAFFLLILLLAARS